MDKFAKQKAGHYEIQGETIAKFEFFDNGFNPYSRYLDVDKVDLILRTRNGNNIKYIEVQVKYGRLYKCGVKWQQEHFDYTSWRFFKLNEFNELINNNLYIAYVLAHPEGYKGDIFIFSAQKFNELINQAIISNTKKGKMAKICIAHCKHNDKWYMWRKLNFKTINETNSIEVTKYRRNFEFI